MTVPLGPHFVSDCALIAFAHAMRDRLQRSSARRYLDRVTGTVIAAFGIRLALGR
ncbi:hypothetical protein [Streptomyces sp. NRRL S-337]|uniref:hypothetical protein n=1 Tax=Streptomyces sp. NRRL S-337 TaxID=1463900 RepID=UPI001F1DA126|nr:hypothetical protein [Streptomyces sp. NRRL S-337]